MNECKNKSILIKCGHKTVKQEQMKISAAQTQNNRNWDFDVLEGSTFRPFSFQENVQ